MKKIILILFISFISCIKTVEKKVVLKNIQPPIESGYFYDTININEKKIIERIITKNGDTINNQEIVFSEKNIIPEKGKYYEFVEIDYNIDSFEYGHKGKITYRNYLIDSLSKIHKVERYVFLKILQEKNDSSFYKNFVSENLDMENFYYKYKTYENNTISGKFFDYAYFENFYPKDSTGYKPGRVIESETYFEKKITMK